MTDINQEVNLLYRFLHDEVAWIHYRVQVFRQLFESDPEVHDLLRWASAWVFYLFYIDMLNGIVLSLTRLTDPAKQGKKGQYENSTLEYLINQLRRTEPGSLIEKLNHHLKTMKSLCSRIDAWRRKVAAHRDIKTVTKPPPYEPIAFDESDLALALVELRSLMNELQTSCAGRYGIAGPFDYTWPAPFDDGDSLISVLRKAFDSSAPPSTDTPTVEIGTK